jgi:hypothetical protein
MLEESLADPVEMLLNHDTPALIDRTGGMAMLSFRRPL